MYDYLVVGSGLYGAIFAHEAKAHGKSVLVVDKRPNIAGNIYTENIEGINVHKYGAHIFHTNNKKVWNYITQFAEFNRFTNSPVANYKGELYSLPFNKMIDEFYRIAHKAINFVFLIALPMMLYFMIFAKEGIFFLSGSAYEKSILPMQVIMPTLLFIGLTNVMGIQMLVPLGKEKIVLYSEIAGAVVDLIVNFALIPRYASVGAAIGTLAAEIVVWVVQFGALKQDIIPAYKKIQYPQMLLALVIGCVASVWVKMLGWNSFFVLLLSAILFFGSYGLVLLIAHEPLVLEIVTQVIDKAKKVCNK